MPYVSIYVPALQRLLLPTMADPVTQNARAREIRLADVGNASLPEDRPLADDEPTTGWNLRRTGAGLVLLAAGCCIAYWTFGRSIFVPGSRHSAVPVDRPSDTRIIDWASFDQMMRRSWG